MLGPAATASAPGAGAPAPFRVRRQQASAMTHAELAAALLGTQIARGHGDLDLWRRQLRTVTVATFILAVATTRISAFLVWVSAFRVSALAFLLFEGEHSRNPGQVEGVRGSYCCCERPGVLGVEMKTLPVKLLLLLFNTTRVKLLTN